MRSRDIRQSFIDFFAARDHEVYPSAPLVPHGDPTLLFTNAGMVPFKKRFLGEEAVLRPRAVSAQKCLRVSGKHNDLENVGPSPRHHTFFEMLGNFSFGDYFKETAIAYGWELVTEVWGLDPSRLFATVFEDDDEAYDLWLELSSLGPDRVHRCGKADNFWAMGETGPCGPCSEIFVDLAPEGPQAGWQEGSDSGRYLEIWNLVFMQFDRQPDGALVPLPNPSIDTGSGLERVAAVLQGVDSNYDTDLFQPLLEAAAEVAGTSYGRSSSADVSLRVIADHLRATAFLLADGVIASNEGRGYVLRRLLRRAVRHGQRLGLEGPFMAELVPVLTAVMASAYPELEATEEASAASLQEEEEKFLSTLASGARHVQQAIESARDQGCAKLDGETTFRLYDTHGVHLDVIKEIAEEESFGVDEAGFHATLDGRRAQSREGGGPGLLEALRGAFGKARAGETEFVGYDELSLVGAEVLALARRSGKVLESVETLGGSEAGVVVLDRTVFYAESGGQVGDTGEIRWPGGCARVVATLGDAGRFFHSIVVSEGELRPGAQVDLGVDEALRRRTERHHTATHLLHAALRQRLGSGVRQAGSLVEPDRLRFDFTHGGPLSDEDREVVEDTVNDWVRRSLPVEIEWRPYAEAVAAGAMALFGEKYGDRVRTVEVPGFSLELCGGCHVANSGQVGSFVLLSERGVASGVRRIEALSGELADAHRRTRERALLEIAAALGTPAERAAEEIASLKERLRSQERDLAELRQRLVTGKGAAAEAQTLEVDGVKILTREVPFVPANELRTLADVLRGQLGSGVVVVGTRDGERVDLVTAVTEDLAGRVHAGHLAKRVGGVVDGNGGGRPDFAQAGGTAPQRLPEALAAVADAVRDQLGSGG